MAPKISSLHTHRTVKPIETEMLKVNSVRDVPADAFIKAYAKHLKRVGKLQVPEWTTISKTASFKETQPEDPDWYYVRAAAILRKVYLQGTVGIGALSRHFSAGQKRGVRPTRHAKPSGHVLRSILQQLEQLDLLKKNPRGGRSVTPAGQKDADRVAVQIKVLAL